MSASATQGGHKSQCNSVVQVQTRDQSRGHSYSYLSGLTAIFLIQYPEKNTLFADDINIFVCENNKSA